MSEPLLRNPADFRPWKPAALADVTPLGAARPNASKPAAEIDPKKQIEAERQRARVEGYNIGYKAGQDAGTAAVQAAAERLGNAVSATQQAWHNLEHDLSEQVLDLALEVARQVLRHDLKARRDALFDVVREAMQCVTEGALRPEMRLHPADVDLVRGAIGDELQRGNWKLVEDHRIEPGGCRISTSQGEIDATLPTRWKRVVAALGRDTEWADTDE